MPLNIHKFPSVASLELLLKELPKDHPACKEWAELLNFITGLHRSQQGALSVSARTNLAYRIYRHIVEDPDYEGSASDSDYEDEYHANVRKLMSELRSEKDVTE